MKKESDKPLRASQFNLRQLTLVSWLLSAPEGSRRFVVASGRMLKFFETGAVREDGKLPVTVILDDGRSPASRELEAEFGGKIKVSPDDLVQSGLLTCFHTRYPAMDKAQVSFAEKVADIYIEGSWGLGGSYYEIGGDWVRDWYAQNGASRRRKLLDALLAKSEAVRRRAVFGRTWRIEPRIPEELSKLLPARYSLNLPSQTIRRPCVIATVTAETDKRFKVRDIKPINGNSSTWLGLTIGKDEFFEREYLMLDNATDADVAALAAFDEEYVREVQEIADQALAEIVPILSRMGDRMNQKQGQHSDMLADLVLKLADAKKE